MERIEFITPSGHTISIKPYLTFGQSRAIEKLWMSTMKVVPGQQEPTSSIDASIVYEAQDMAVKFLVEKITTNEDKVFQGDTVLDVIASMKEEDGRAIYAKIDEIASAKALPPEDSDAKKN